MTEFELKLEVPPEQRSGVSRNFSMARRKRLQARYFDTDERALARCKVVVRVRKEGNRWVQTAKASSGSSLERLEHNVDLARSPGGLPPAVDLSRHAGTQLEARLREALGLQAGDSFPELSLVFETDIQRRVLNVEAGRSTVEVAFDQGRVAAGDRHSDVCEVEFELKSGNPADAVRLARTWCARHKLWLSSISKSAKGQRLADAAAPAATMAQATSLSAAAGIRETAVAMVRSCMDHVLPNASEIAAGSSNRDQIHQMRIGLRRLRSVLRELGNSAGGFDAAWEPELARVFRILGQHRDGEFLTLRMQPQLAAAGGPALHAALAAEPPDPGHAVRSPSFQCTLLDLLTLAHAEPNLAAVGRDSALAVLQPLLKKLHRQIVKQGRVFLNLGETRQHRLRKRLKRLRYLAELVKPLFKQNKVERFLENLKPVQDALGVYNDRLMALEAYRKLSHSDPGAWFGVGWLSAHRQEDAAACQRDLQALAKIKVFW